MATSQAQQKVAFITGGASGIGLATAELLVQDGFAVVLVDRNEAAGRAEEQRLRRTGACSFVGCDVTDEAAVRRAVEFAVGTYGRLDAAFNAAGLDGDKGLLADSSTANWNRVIGINLTGVFHCMRYQIAQMLKNGGGSIVNCSSVAGVVGAPYLSAYVASKHGVIGLTRAAALDYGKQGIRVNAVCPAFIDTPLSRESLPPEHAEALKNECPMGRFADASEVATAVRFLLGGDSSFITGQALSVDGAWTTR